MGCGSSRPKTNESPETPKRHPEAPQTKDEAERGPDEDLIEFCKAMEDTFVPQSIWIGNIEIKNESTYLELCVVQNEDKSGIEVWRIIDMDATLDEKRFAQFREFSIKPHNKGLNEWIAQLYYEDYDKKSDMKFTLTADFLNPRKYSVKGTCSVMKDGQTRSGEVSFVRVMAPKQYEKRKLNPKLSILINKYTDTNKVLHEVPLFSKTETMTQVNNRVDVLDKEITRKWNEYNKNTILNLEIDDDYLSDVELANIVRQTSLKYGGGSDFEDMGASASSPYIFSKPEFSDSPV